MYMQELHMYMHVNGEKGVFIYYNLMKTVSKVRP